MTRRRGKGGQTFENTTQQAVTKHALAELLTISRELTPAGRMLAGIKKLMIIQEISEGDISTYIPTSSFDWVKVRTGTHYNDEAIDPNRLMNLLIEIFRASTNDPSDLNALGVRNSNMKRALQGAIAETVRLKSESDKKK